VRIIHTGANSNAYLCCWKGILNRNVKVKVQQFLYRPCVLQKFEVFHVLGHSAQDGLDNPRNISVLLVQQQAFSERQIAVAPLGMGTAQPNAPTRDSKHNELYGNWEKFGEGFCL